MALLIHLTKKISLVALVQDISWTGCSFQNHTHTELNVHISECWDKTTALKENLPILGQCLPKLESGPLCGP